MVKHQRVQKRLRYAAHTAVEQLEERRLFETVTASGNTVMREYFVAGNTTVRMVFSGNITAEVIALEVNPGSTDAMNPIPVGQRTLLNPLPASPMAPTAPDVGADIFKIYISAADEDSFISIASVANQSTSGTPRPMMPFNGAPTMSVRNIDNDGDPLIAPALGSVGSVYIGARDIDRPDTPPANGIYPANEQDPTEPQNRPILSYGDQPGDNPVGAIGVMPAPANGVVVPGIETAPGVNIGKILIGGVVTGKVILGGSCKVFYAGAVLTGNARGIERFADLRNADPESTPTEFDPDNIDDNFFVAGDLHALVTAGSIGTDTLAADDPLDNRHYSTGADIRVMGRIGTILTDDFYAGARADATRPAFELSSNIQELEFRAPDFTQGRTLFEEGNIGERNALASVRNDTFATPQMLHSYFDSSLGLGDAIQVDGELVSAANVNDDLDFYGLPLLAGQTVTVDLSTPIFGSTSALNVGVMDPDGRVIATDYQVTTGNATGLQGVDPNAPFQFTATKPGIHRIVISSTSDFEFDGGATQRPVVTYSRSVAPYTLTILGADDINFGAVDARGSLITDVTANDTITVIDGDLGAILAGDTFAQDGIIDLQTRRYWVNSGNLRAIVAESIGFSTNNPVSIQASPHLHVRKGVVGHVRSLGTGDTDILYLNDSDATASTGSVARNTAVGVDYQVVESATGIIGSFIAKRAIGVIRAATLSHNVNGINFPVSYYVANSDGKGSDGSIGLIDTPGNFGNNSFGGPAIDVGSDGNVRYLNVGGLTFKDPFFGAPNAAGERITAQANTAVTLTDDSGTDVTLTPVTFTNTRGFGQPVNTSGTTSGTISYTAYPVRSVSGGRAGVVLVNVTSTTGLRIASTPRGGSAVVDIADIDVLGPGTTASPLRLLMDGQAPVNVFNITGNNFTELSNGTGGEVVSLTATGATLLAANTLGLTPLLNGIALLPVTARIVDTYPFEDQRTLIQINGNATTIQARRGLGNINVTGNVTTITANSDNNGVGGVFEGINEPILIGGSLTNLNIGEGVLPSGSSEIARSGVYVASTISNIRNSGLGSDIRGDIVANLGIGSIELTDGAIIGADIAVVDDFEDTTNLPQPYSTTDVGIDSLAEPAFEIGSITVTGLGGIIGSFIRSADVGPILVNGGFGMISTTVQAAGDSLVSSINLDGYGMRSSLIDGGSDVQNITANGSGKRLDTNSYTSSVRQSASSAFDPFFGTTPNVFTDLHAFLGTTEASPKRKGVSNQGIIADSQVLGSRNLGTMQAWQIQSRDPFIRDPGSILDGTPIPFSAPQFPMRTSFGVRINSVRTTSDIVGLSMQGGRLQNLVVGGAVERTLLGISGRVENIDIAGTFKGTSQLLVTGPEGALVQMRTGGSLFGQVNVALGVGSTVVGGDFGSPSYIITSNIDNLDISGDVLSGSRIRTKKTIVNLIIDGDVQAGATIQAKVISNQQISGDVFGNIIVG